MKKSSVYIIDGSLGSYVESRDMAVFLWDGMKGRSTFPRLTSIRPIQTDMQGMICIQRRNVGHLLGKIVSPTLWVIGEIVAQKQNRDGKELETKMKIRISLLFLRNCRLSLKDRIWVLVVRVLAHFLILLRFDYFCLKV